MLEYQQPIVPQCVGEQLPFRFQRHQRLHVVAHDPRQRQVVRRGDDIAKKAGRLAAGPQHDALVMRCVPGREPHGYAGHNLPVPRDEVEAVGRDDGRPVGRKVAGRCAFVGVLGVRSLTGLHDESRIGKRRHDFTARILPAVATSMIEVQMGVDDEPHVVGLEAGLANPILERGASVGPFVLHTVDLVELRNLLVAKPGVEEHEAVIMLDQQTAHAERNAVPRIGGNATFPERLGNDAEHGAAIELLAPGLNGMDAPAAERTRVD